MSRKLDAAIAEALGKAVRWHVCVDHGMQGDRYYDAEPPDRGARPYLHTCGGARLGEVPHYSTDGNDMLRLDAEMQKRGWLLDTWSETGVYALFKRREDVDDADVTGWVAQGHADTMPLAVALAAYHALTGKEWTG